MFVRRADFPPQRSSLKLFGSMSFMTRCAKQPGYTEQSHPDSPAAPPSPSLPLFDRWFAYHLRRLYEPVVEETISDDLIRRLQQKLG